MDHLFRRRAGQMIAALTRIFGPEELDLVEDVVQEAFLVALRQWPFSGLPANPSAWLIQVAKNRALDLVRRRANWQSKRGEIESAVSRRQDLLATDEARFADEIRDDELRMVFMCCHPDLSRDARVALTLKMVAAFSVGEIARAFLSRESTIAQRLVRAKRKLREVDARFEVPAAAEMPSRLESIQESLYLIFNEGYSAYRGENLVRLELCQQAIRLVELLAGHPSSATPAVHALAALLFFQGARLSARTDEDGNPLRLEEQNRARWDRAMAARALEHFEAAATGTELTRYHLEAEIASLHVLAESYEATDWKRILSAYDQLLALEPTPVVALNRAIALSRMEGPQAGLEGLRTIESEPALAGYHPFFSTRAELLTQAGRPAEAVPDYRKALELAGSAPLRRLLMRRLAEAERLAGRD